MDVRCRLLLGGLYYGFSHLCLDERITIQTQLHTACSFKQIAKTLHRDPSTISKEIRSHLLIKQTGSYGRPFNDCLHRFSCSVSHLCGDTCHRTCHFAGFATVTVLSIKKVRVRSCKNHRMCVMAVQPALVVPWKSICIMLPSHKRVCSSPFRISFRYRPASGGSTTYRRYVISTDQTGPVLEPCICLSRRCTHGIGKIHLSLYGHGPVFR